MDMNLKFCQIFNMMYKMSFDTRCLKQGTGTCNQLFVPECICCECILKRCMTGHVGITGDYILALV